MIYRKTDDKLIESALKEGWLSYLAFYYKLKIKFINSVIYNYSCRSLADKLNISHNTARKYINFLIKKGFIVKQENHFKIIKLDDLIFKYNKNKKYKETLIFNDSDISISKIKYLLYGKVIEKRARQQSYVIKKRDCDLRTKINYSGQRVKKIFFSYEKLSHLLGITNGSVKRLLEFLVEYGIISKKYYIEKYIDCKYSEYKFLKKQFNLNQGYFYQNNSIFKIKGTIINFSHFSITP